MNRDEWLQQRVRVLKNLKTRTEPQRLLVLLTEKPDRSAAENQMLAALIRVEQANDRAAQARVAVAKLIQASKAPVGQGRTQGPRSSLDPAGRLVRSGGFGVP